MTTFTRTLLGISVAAAYIVALLLPFDWSPPVPTRNWANFAADGMLQFEPPGPGIAYTSVAPDWVGEVIKSHQLDVFLRVRPALSDQKGPARLMTLSKDLHHRSFTLGQEGQDLRVRVHTPLHTPNGTPEVSVANIFAAGEWVEIHVSVGPDGLYVSVDGAQQLSLEYPPEPFASWDRSYRFALGNELTLDRPWVGDIARAEVRVGDAVHRYAKPNALEIPAMLPGPKPHLALFRNVGVVDGILNVIGFMPLGLLGWIWIGRRHRAWSGTVSAIVIIGSITLFSAALEFIQLGIPERFCSINDVFFNGLGGTLGVLIGRIRGRTTLGSAALANARSGTHGE